MGINLGIGALLGAFLLSICKICFLIKCNEICMLSVWIRHLYCYSRSFNVLLISQLEQSTLTLCRCLNTESSVLMCMLFYKSGVDCEIDVDECESSPCRNKATCIDLEGTFECKCTDGFQGTMCELNLDECAAKPCRNNATCFDAANGYR